MKKENRDIKAACQLFSIVCIVICLLCVSPMLLACISIIGLITYPFLKWVWREYKKSEKFNHRM